MHAATELSALPGFSSYRGAPVLVLGASGFIGARVARALRGLGADLHLVARDAASLPPDAGAVHEADLALPGAAADLCRSLRPAAVFNLAGYGVDPGEREEAPADRLNRALPAELARVLDDRPTRGSGASSASSDWPGRGLVHAGSALEYGPQGGPVCESLASRPDTLYGRSKQAGARAIEEVAAAGSLRAVEARIFTAYGPGERAGRLLPTLLAARGHREPLPLTDGRQPRDFVFVDDVAEALLRLAVDPSPGFLCVNVATGTLHTVRQFVEIAAEVLGLSEGRLRFGARGHLREEMWHGPVSVERLRRQVGWTPPTLPREGIEATVTEMDREERG